MIDFTPRGLKQQSQERLRGMESDARRLVLIHTGVIVLLSLLSSGLNMYLDYQIGDTGGLSGLGARSFLQTLQTVLQYAITLFTPFWSAGFLWVSLRFANGQRPGEKDLLSGFKRFSSILSYQILLMLLYFALAMACAYITSILYSMTSFADPVAELLEPMVASGSIDMSAIPAEALLSAYVPMLVIYCVVLLPVLVFFTYSLRLSEYFIMDQTRMSGMRALRSSMQAMRGHRFQMFKLDLSFWWFYLLEGILMVVCYLDVLLPLFGIALPFNEVVAYFVCLILYCVLELLLHLWKKPQIDVTYALAYQSIVHPDNQDLTAQN